MVCQGYNSRCYHEPRPPSPCCIPELANQGLGPSSALRNRHKHKYYTNILLGACVTRKCLKKWEQIKCLISKHIQLSEKQQLGLARRFEKYSEIQGEREKMSNQRNFSQVYKGGINSCTQMEKKKRNYNEHLRPALIF